jgi:hypothetical protein
VEWIYELMRASRDGWRENVDVEKQLEAEQKWMEMAVDMAVAEKVEVFLSFLLSFCSIFVNQILY